MKHILALFLLSACAHPVPISKPGDGLWDAYTAITHLKRSGTYFTPTLAFYSANVNLPPDSATRAGRREALEFLVELTGRMHRVGIPILAGTDLATRREDHRPGTSLLEEITWLEKAGLSESEARRAASDNVRRWLISTN